MNEMVFSACGLRWIWELHADPAYVHAGAKQLSFATLLLAPSFKDQVELQHTPSVLKNMGTSQADLPVRCGDQLAREAAGSKNDILDWQNDDTHDISIIMQRLAIIYSWAKETFSALDLQNKGIIDLERSGAALFNIFSEMKIAHLWDSLQKVLDGETSVTHQQFIAVFFLWMGIDEQFELSCQQGACMHGAPMPSRCYLELHSIPSRPDPRWITCTRFFNACTTLQHHRL